MLTRVTTKGAGRQREPPRPEDAALELGLRGLGPKRGRTALGRARDEAKVAGKGYHGALALGPVAGSASYTLRSRCDVHPMQLKAIVAWRMR